MMLLIAAGTGFGTISTVWIGSRRLFSDRQGLRLNRLNPVKQFKIGDRSHA